MGHNAKVKEKLIALLTSEVVAVSEMSHETAPVASSINDEGGMACYICVIV